MTQDHVTYTVAAGSVTNYFTNWVGMLPDQTLQNIVLELSAFWLILQIVLKLKELWSNRKK